MSSRPPRPAARLAWPVASLVLFTASCRAATPIPTPVLTLEGPTWRLASYAGPDGGTVPVPADASVTAEFADGKLSGTGVCNEYSVAYKLNGGTLLTGAQMATQRPCLTSDGSVDHAYLNALGRVAAQAVVAGHLQLRDASGATILSFEAVPATPPG